MKLNSWALGIIVAALIFGGIGLTMAFNLWQTEGGSGSGGTKVPTSITNGEYAGEANPADIRGAYTFQDISIAWNIPVDNLAEAFGLTGLENAAYTRCGDLEHLYTGVPEGIEVGTDSVRVFVALYTGLPYLLLDDTYLLQPAADILLAEAALDEEQRAFLNTNVIGIEGISVTPPAADADAETHDEDAEIGLIKGYSTFQNLLDWGLTETEISAVIGDSLPVTGTTIRDYAEARGLEFSVIKMELQAKLDALK
jgi:hypothetical protein